MSDRGDALKALERAEAELGAMDDERLKYACLELRMAMESLTYDRALAYKDEFPEHEYDTWQPKKVMAVLLEIDANADKDSSIAFGEEPAPGVPAPVMHSLGTEIVLNMATIKQHYDALGSYLHVQTVKQLKMGVKVDHTKVRKRCEEIAAYLAKVLSSPVWNSTFGTFATFDCECGAKIRRRLPLEGGNVEATCGCGWQFDIETDKDGTFAAKPRRNKAVCAKEACEGWTYVPAHQAVVGNWWTCGDCGGRNEIRLGLVYLGNTDGEKEGCDATS